MAPLAPPASIANTYEEETRLFAFPTFDFINVVAGVFNGGQNGIPMTLPTDGRWTVWGVVASRLIGPAGSLASGTNVDINIYDPALSRFWFSGGSSNDGVGFPVELVSGKAGNIHYFDVPKILEPGHRLNLYASHAGATPTASSPLYVGLVCSLLPKGVDAKMLTLESFSEGVKNRDGEMYKVRANFNFATNNLPDQTSRKVQVPLNKREALLVTGISVRHALNSELDPRVTEDNLLLQLSDSRNLSTWSQPDPSPLSAFAGVFGSRIWVPATFFLVMPGMDLIVELTNKTGVALVADIPFVLHCANIKGEFSR